MTYQLSEGQIADVETLRNQGKYAAAYQYIHLALSIPVENEEVDPNVQKWFGMAAQINGDFGTWVSEYVRTYTINAGALKGIEITDEDFQDASDHLAQTILDSIINNNGEIPTVQEIIDADIGGVVSDLGLENEDYAGTFVACQIFGFDTLAEYVFNDTPAPQELIDLGAVPDNSAHIMFNPLFKLL